MRRVFLLSPASSSGERARVLLRDAAAFPLARQVRAPEGAPIGDVFTFLSGLYFRGKRAYAEAFARPPRGVPGALVITPCRGLWPIGRQVTAAVLREFAAVDVDARIAAYRTPLVADARALAAKVGARCQVVLLGSIASGKYVDVLQDIFGDRLLFPVEFVGRGDMSRGGLLLRCAADGIELTYVPVRGALRHGERPPRLPPRPPAARPLPTPPDARPAPAARTAPAATPAPSPAAPRPTPAEGAPRRPPARRRRTSGPA